MKGRVLVALVCFVFSQSGVGQDAPAWKPQADAMLATLSPDAPGAAVVVTRQGKVLYSAARGLASLELGVPLRPDSAFRIGSLTKTVTAAAIMRLHAQGRIDLDAKIATWLTGFPHAAEISVRQLLSHTSGVSDGWEAPLTEVLDTPARLRLIGSVPLDFAPGTDWRYSNSGYMLLGAILEKITGKPWYDAETELVLAPLGLSQMAFHDDAAIVPRMASGYSADAAGHAVRPTPYSTAGPGAAGALTSTAGDVAALLHGIATGASPGRDAFRAMATPSRIGDVELPYGLGVVPTDIRGTPAIEHLGGIEGYTAHYVYAPAEDIAVVVLENSDAPRVPARSLARRLAAVALGHPYRSFAPEAWDAPRLRATAGTYAIGDGSCHTVALRDGALWIHRDGGPEKRLDTAAGSTLIYAGDGIDYMHPVDDGKGHVIAMAFHVDGADTARREARIDPGKCGNR